MDVSGCHVYFLLGTLAPLSLAFDSPMATACLRLVTFLPWPLLRLACLNSRTVFSTFSCALGPYFAISITPHHSTAAL